MNIQLAAILEKLKNGDIKSGMDQIKTLYSDVSVLKDEIANIYTKLSEKASLISEKQLGLDTVSKLGSGVIASITNSGTVINGSGTFFTKEAAIGNQIKVGSEITTISSFDATTPDTKIVVTPAIVGTYTNQIYAIIKSATREVFTGEFDFGELNGDPFSGVIKQGSSLEHYGRIIQPADLVNVSYVQKQITPIMVRAQNAIQRDGDTIIGPSNTNRYEYLFDKTNLTFDSNTELFYNGPATEPNHIVTLAKLADTETSIRTMAFGIWDKITSAGYSISVAGANIQCRFNPAELPTEYSDNFISMFEITSSGLKVKASAIPSGYNGILLAVNASAGWFENRGADQYRVNCNIYKNTRLLAGSVQQFDGPSGFGARPSATVSAIVPLLPTDFLVVGARSNDDLTVGVTIDHWLNITKIGIF